MTTNNASSKAKDLLQQEQEQEQAARLAAAEAAIFGGFADDDDEEDFQDSLEHAKPSGINTISSKTIAAINSSAAPATDSLAADAAAEAEPALTPEPQEAEATVASETADSAETAAPSESDDAAARLAAAAAAIFNTPVESAKNEETASATPAPADDMQARLAAAAAAIFNKPTESAENEEAASATPAPADDLQARLAAAAAATFNASTEEAPEANQDLGMPSSELPPELREAQQHLAKWLLAIYNAVLTNQERAQLLEIAAHGAAYVQALQEMAESIITREQELKDMQEQAGEASDAAESEQDKLEDDFDDEDVPFGFGFGEDEEDDFLSAKAKPKAPHEQDEIMQLAQAATHLSKIDDPFDDDDEGGVAPIFAASAPVPPPAPKAYEQEPAPEASAPAPAQGPVVIQPEPATPELQAAIDALLQEEDQFAVSMDDPDATCSQIALLSLREFSPVMSIEERLNFMSTTLYDTEDIWGFQNMMSAVRIRAITAERAQSEPQEEEKPAPAEAEASATAAAEAPAEEEVRTPRVFTSRLKPEERPKPQFIEPVLDPPQTKIIRRKSRTVVPVSEATRTTMGADGKATTTVVTTRRGRRKKSEELNATELKAAAFTALFGEAPEDDTVGQSEE